MRYGTRFFVAPASNTTTECMGTIPESGTYNDTGFAAIQVRLFISYSFGIQPKPDKYPVPANTSTTPAKQALSHD